MRFPRSSGILLHPTSLPGPHGSGDLGPAAYHFVDWLGVAGQKLWQILPLGPPDYANSPYASLSAFAGNPLLVGLEELIERGWLTPDDVTESRKLPKHKADFTKVIPFRLTKLRLAATRFRSKAAPDQKSDYESFCEKNRLWLDDYALFKALIDRYKGVEWHRWDNEIALRKASALEKVRRELCDEIEFWKFAQWCFARQWTNVKLYANERGIQIIGDIPIFIAYQSADVWSHPELFYLDEKRKPSVVAGVPPDYFSKTGQRWGNPLYKWDVLEQTGYQWWIERFQRTFELVDIARVDHFRGFIAYWEIPSTEKTAQIGRWLEGPQDRIFHAVLNKLGKLPIIAEDLGLITPDVYALRDQFNFPGMKVLQFAFADNTANPFLPHNYVNNCVVYTGTHDNDTTISWYEKATERERVFLSKYLKTNGKEIHWDLIRLASQSIADVCVFPMQDVLGLGTEARMNFPGVALGNWEWRFSWEQVNPTHADRLYELTATYNRCPADRLKLPSYPTNKQLP